MNTTPDENRPEDSNEERGHEAPESPQDPSSTVNETRDSTQGDVQETLESYLNAPYLDPSEALLPPQQNETSAAPEDTSDEALSVRTDDLQSYVETVKQSTSDLNRQITVIEEVDQPQNESSTEEVEEVVEEESVESENWWQRFTRGIRERRERVVQSITSDGMTNNALRRYRELREDTGVSDLVQASEVSTGSVAGAVGTTYLTGLAAYGNAALTPLSLSVSSLGNAIPYAGTALGLGWLSAEGFNGWLKERTVQRNYMNAVRSTMRNPDDDEDVVRLQRETQERFSTLQRMPSNDLVNHPDERRLLIAFDKVMPSPTAVPYLGTENRYVRFVYNIMLRTCDFAQARNPNLPHHLTEEERNDLAMFSLAAITDNDVHRERRAQLEEVCAAYGRLLRSHHISRRHRLIDGVVWGGTLAATVATGGVGPLIGAGVYHGVKRFTRSRGQDLEFGPDGRVRGRDNRPILDPQTIDAAGVPILHHPDLLERFKTEDDLSDNEKRWIQHIHIPNAILQRNHRSAEQLMINCAPDVAQNLVGFTMENRVAPNETRVTQLQTERDRAAQRLETMEDRLAEAETSLSEVQQSLNQLRAQGNADIDPEQFDPSAMEHSRRQNDINQLQQRERRLEIDISRLRGEADQAGSIAAQQERVQALERQLEDERNPSSQDAPLTLASIATNQEIARAFAVVVNRQYQIIEERRNQFWSTTRGGFSNAIRSRPAIEAGRATAVGGIYAGLAAGIVSYVPGLSMMISPWAAAGIAATIGLGRHVIRRVSN